MVDVLEKLNDSGMRLPICTRAWSLTCQHVDLEVLISRWTVETHTIINSWVEFTLQSKMSFKQCMLLYLASQIPRESSLSRKMRIEEEMSYYGHGGLEVIGGVYICVVVMQF